MKQRTRLDERSFEQLLAAAYVLQQLRDTVPASSSSSTTTTSTTTMAHSTFDESARLAAIAETQTTVHGNKLGLQETLQLVAERAAAITHGAGAAVWLVQGKNAVCRAACGVAEVSLGKSIAVTESRLTPCFQDGAILRCEDAKFDPRARYDALPGTAEGSVLAVPIHHEERVEGALEVSFAQARGFGEMDLRTCQILSGLVSEAVAMSAEQEWKHVLESERATLLEALDRIQPHLSKLLSAADATPDVRTAEPVVPVIPEPPAPTHGMARLGKFLLAQQRQENGSEMPSLHHHEPEEHADTASSTEANAEAWRTREALLQEQRPGRNFTKLPSNMSAREVQTALNLSIATANTKTETAPWQSKTIDSHEAVDTGEIEQDHDFDQDFEDHKFDEKPLQARDFQSEFRSKTLEEPFSEHAAEDETHVSGALALRDMPWLHTEAETLDAEESTSAPIVGFWQIHWADVCLAVSAALLALTLGWAIWPQTKNIAETHAAAAQPKLSVFEEFLVAVGLAEAPPPVAAYTGAPGTKVWVDLHSALYYCPGAEPYGKTPKGKFLAQHDAQYEQFQPARGQPCD
jgi:GAF domain